MSINGHVSIYGHMSINGHQRRKGRKTMDFDRSSVLGAFQCSPESSLYVFSMRDTHSNPLLDSLTFPRYPKYQLNIENGFAFARLNFHFSKQQNQNHNAKMHYAYPPLLLLPRTTPKLTRAGVDDHWKAPRTLERSKSIVLRPFLL
jgi:hypothetical protein